MYENVVVYTIGHSTRTIEEFVRILRAAGIRRLVDIRTIPKSRRNPQFDTENLSKSLGSAGIEYLHMKELGGFRSPKKDSRNTGWRNDSFRGFADYMQTPGFDSALAELVRLSAGMRTVVMCAEAVPWRCHRSLVGDALLAKGIAVKDIVSEGSVQPHVLTSFARIDGGKVSYPAMPLFDGDGAGG